MPHISRLVLWFFRRIVRRYFRRQFTAVRLSHDSNLAGFGDEKLIVYGNHSSWWDPMVLVLLAAKLMPRRKHYAPMDATSLERYRIFKRFGVFGVEMNSARGAAKFLRTGIKIMAERGVLWVTPQGRFADVRERPLGFKPGLAALAAKVQGGCTVLPLAIEYVFWNERLPETLLHFGDPVRVSGQDAEEVQQLLEAALLHTMEALKAKAIARDSSAFSVVQRGRVGAGGFYQLGQRIVAAVRRQPYEPAHASLSAAVPRHHEETHR